MFVCARVLLSVVAATAFLAACSKDGSTLTSPAARPAFQGSSSTDTSLLGGGGGGGSVAMSCGTLSSNINTYNIVVYTTRIGIGFNGSATNCSTRNEAFEVVVNDVNPDPVCHVNVPHFLAAKNTAPGETVNWNANSTLVNCLRTTHTFTLTLVDTKTGQSLATTTVSAFL